MLHVNLVNYINIEIIEKEINLESSFIVIASDGVWEFLDNQKVVDLVRPFFSNRDPEGACETLINEATKFWQKVRNFYPRKTL